MLENYVTCRATCVCDEFKMDEIVDIDYISLQWENVHKYMLNARSFTQGLLYMYLIDVILIYNLLHLFPSFSMLPFNPYIHKS